MPKSLRVVLLLFVGTLFAASAAAQPGPYDGGPGPGNQGDPPSRVGRLSYLRGAVSFVPAGENDWVEADLNRPLITGDRLWTDRDSRAEIDLGTAAVRIDEETSFDFLNLDDDNAQIELTHGSLNLDVRRLYDNQVYEVDTPTLAFVIDRVGEYRLTVEPDGRATVVSVLRGAGDAYGENDARFAIEEGQSVTFYDPTLRDYYTDNLPPPDAFDDFCADRDARWARSRSREYVAEGVIGYDDLDANGDWQDVPEYGRVWYPTTVAAGWAPYRYGHWAWVGVYGWTWIDDAPWGFAPFHYGRWVHVHNRWGWCPGPRHVRAYYAPALVAFIGGGGVRVGVSVGGPVGWFPLGPRDVYFPGYRVSRHYFREVNVTNTVLNVTVVNNYYGNFERGRVNYSRIRFANRNVVGAVTAVPAAAFIGARPVAAAAIAVNRATFRNARISAYAALAPTRASLVRSGARAGRRPPAAMFDRKIVAASRPPPRIASFATREAMLRKNPGRPLGRQQMHPRTIVPERGANARRNAFAARENVRVVTRTGIPARSAAKPIMARPRSAEARRGLERGKVRGERGAPVRQGAGPERRLEPGQRAQPAREAQMQRERQQRDEQARQAQMQRERQQRDQQAREAQMQRERAQRDQQGRQAQMQRERAQRDQQARQAQMQRERAQRDQQTRQAQMQRERAQRDQQARQAQMQRERAQPDQRARQAQMQRERAQRDQQARQAQMQRARQAEQTQRAQQQQMRQHQQPQRAPQQQQQRGGQQNQGKHGNNRNKKDDDNGRHGGGGH